MSIQSSIRSVVDKAIEERVFPGCVVGYARQDGTATGAYGSLTYQPSSQKVSPDTLYDVASVTKSIPVASLIHMLVQQNRLSYDDRIVDYVPEIRNAWRDKIMLRHALSYTVVLDTGKGLSNYARESMDALEQAVFESDLVAPPGSTYRYTNPPAIWLGLVIERVTGQRLDIAAAKMLFEPLRMSKTTFAPGVGLEQIAPTELDSRGEVRGIVHDESAWRRHQSGLVSGNAGLFSTAPDLLRFCQMVLNGGRLDDEHFFRSETLAQMETDQTQSLGTATGLGWEMARPEFMGDQASPRAIAKTGFTGCLVMIDRERKAALVMLSNRTFPHRGSRDGIDDARRRLADIIFRKSE